MNIRNVIKVLLAALLLNINNVYAHPANECQLYVQQTGSTLTALCGANQCLPIDNVYDRFADETTEPINEMVTKYKWQSVDDALLLSTTCKRMKNDIASTRVYVTKFNKRAVDGLGTSPVYKHPNSSSVIGRIMPGSLCGEHATGYAINHRIVTATNGKTGRTACILKN